MRIKTIVRLCWIVCLLPLAWTIPGWSQESTPLSSLEFHSSNASLNASFLWAKQQALAYARSGSGSIGPWYEAALPGRNAFCMRDVSHQTGGAAALGLFAANRNMLNRFATSAAPSRNWAGYWEIDGNGMPSTADYRSDDDFWFNLPANFDVLDAIVRMWRWTGDDIYKSDPRLKLFFRKTLTDYIAQWQLQPEAILTRPRIANQRLAGGQFIASRGIPSYIEGPKNFVLGTDLLAAEYRAIRSYQEIAVEPEDKQLAARMQKAADAIQHILETAGWSPQEGHFHGVIQQDLHGFGSADTFILYFDAAKDPSHVRGALDYVANPAYWQTINIEEESYLPTVLFRYARPAVAYRVLLDLSAPGKPRREYPEVSYGVIAALISGAMGIEPAHAADAFDVQTLPQPMAKADNLSVASLHIKSNILDITHTGETRTQFINRQGPAIRWKAQFVGTEEMLRVNDRWEHAEHGSLPGGTPISWIIVTVPPAGSVTVSREKQ
jgi:hypothetical protein